MSSSDPRPAKLAILTNVLAPYRVPVFQRLAEHYEVTVLYSGEESNRDQWKHLTHQHYSFKVKRATGFTFRWTKRDRGAALDTGYLHLNPGLFTDLIRIRPDAIITNEMGFRSLVALVYGSMFGCPVWVWWGGTRHTERGIGTIKRIFRRHFIPRVRRWFSYGASSTEYLTSLGVPKETVVELQNCVFERGYTETVSPAIQLEIRPVLLCVGQLIPRKGIDILLQAASRLQAEGLAFSLLVVGDGPEKLPLQQRAEELRLQNVYFYPARDSNNMPAVYRSGDILVFPTLEDVWGLVVNEALWSGLPALVSIYAGCARELVPMNSIFDPLDPAGFDRKLRDAVAGELPRPDLTRLRRIDEVANIVVRELDRGLRETNGDYLPTWSNPDE